MSRMTVSTLVLLASALALAPGQAPQRLFAVGDGFGDGSSNLLEITDWATAPVAVDLGETGVVLTAIAAHPQTGELWAIDAAGGSSGTTLYRLDAATAAATPVGPLLTANQTALEFDALGRLWCWGTGVFTGLSLLDQATGAATMVSPGVAPGSAMAFDLDGTLIGASQGWLVTLDADTGAPAGYLANLQIGGFAGLEIDVDGTLYGAVNNSLSPSGFRLQVVDRQAGFAVLPPVDVVGPLTYAAGLAFTRSRGFNGYGASAGTQNLHLTWLPGSPQAPLDGVLKASGFTPAPGGLAFLGYAPSPGLLSVGSVAILLDLTSLQLLAVVPDANGEVLLPLALSGVQLCSDLYLQAFQLVTQLTQSTFEASQALIMNLH